MRNQEKLAQKCRQASIFLLLLFILLLLDGRIESVFEVYVFNALFFVILVILPFSFEEPRG